MEDPVDHALGRSFQLGVHGEKLLVATLVLARGPATSDTLEY